MPPLVFLPEVDLRGVVFLAAAFLVGVAFFAGADFVAFAGADVFVAAFFVVLALVVPAFVDDDFVDVDFVVGDCLVVVVRAVVFPCGCEVIVDPSFRSRNSAAVLAACFTVQPTHRHRGRRRGFTVAL